MLRSFLAALQTGSVSRAAQLVGRTQPAVSQQLHRLEDLLGRQLFLRTNTGIVATPAGEALWPIAERILVLLDGLRTEFHNDVIDGRCRIGLAEDVATNTLVGTLADLRAIYPTLALSVAVEPAIALAAAMHSGELDLMIGDPTQLGGLPRRMTSRRLIWIAGPRFDARTRPLPLIIFEPPCQWSRRIVEVLSAAAIETETAFASSSISAITAASRAGLGLTVAMPHSVPTGCRELRADGQLPLAPTIDIALYRQSGLRRVPHVDQVETWIWRLLA
jgi:DNA-binding transcriptional LysR family regulator